MHSGTSNQRIESITHANMRQSIGAIAKSTIADITIEGSHPG
jgi:hypothetical protein